VSEVQRIVVCRECGEELHPAEVDVATLCEACWEDLTEEAEMPDFDDVGDPLSRRDDEMGM
jgi:predicted Zn-ribbon and HTH transcriptional regulator